MTPERRARGLAFARRIGAVGAGMFSAWLLTWTLAVGALWWGVFAWALVRPPSKRARAGLLATGLLAAPWTLWRYTARVDVLTERVARGGPDALGVLDCVAVWGLNLLMGVTGALLGFPEVAAETLLLAVPRGPSLSVRSDFPLCDPKIARFVDASRNLRDGATARTRVVWTYDAHESARAALALNPADLVVARDGDRLVVRTTVPVDYPSRFRLVLLDAGPLTVSVEEGLFDALEARGWLFPYSLTYESVLPDGAALPAPCEAWSARVARLVR